jgi:hypothetical protein
MSEGTDIQYDNMILPPDSDETETTAKSEQSLQTHGHYNGFPDAALITAIALPQLVLVSLVVAAAHKKRLFPWQRKHALSAPGGSGGSQPPATMTLYDEDAVWAEIDELIAKQKTAGK